MNFESHSRHLVNFVSHSRHLELGRDGGLWGDPETGRIELGEAGCWILNFVNVG